ncbi:glycosyltransferase family 2 protein [Roseateles sp. PN1]|uniref:glycosyltransferase family 2 protein n=1 Tax=Roseateles sp. PN1 TaxID=3137372 RepID=UPI003138B168
MNDISIAMGVLTYRRPELLRDLLHSFMRQSDAQTYRIIVYDNDPAGSAEAIARECVPTAQLRYLKTDSNFGSSGGFNSLFAAALDEPVSHFFCCDDDIELTDDCMDRLLEVALEQPRAVLLGGRRYLSGNEFPWAPTISAADITRVTAHVPVTVQPVPVDTITFEGCLLPIEVLQDVGLPYRNFYMDGDDWDYGLRIRKAGYTILRAPATVIVRKIEPLLRLARIQMLGLSSWRSGIGPERSYYEIRNKFKLIHRHVERRRSALLRETIRSLRRLVGIAAFEDRKLFRTRLVLQAVVHGWANVEGRNSKLRL